MDIFDSLLEVSEKKKEDSVMNRFVFADPNRCIGCRTCEVACVLSHSEENSVSSIDPARFHPRLKLIKNAKVTTPVLCRQCEDAPCAQVCPNNAIVSEDNQIKVIQSRCIGCKTCVIACPYGAMAVVSDMVDNGADSALFKMKVPKAQALKCDLCSGSSTGPACVQVCPTNALQLIEAEDIEKIAKKKREAAAESIAAVAAL